MKGFCALATLLMLMACGHLETRSPPGVDLSGAWVLDAQHSDAPPPLGRRNRSQAAAGPPDAPPRYEGPMPRLSMVTADAMVIAQDAVSMGIDYPNQPYRDIKWGKQKRGLYTIDAGWDAQRLVIETNSKPLDIKETYSLSSSGDTLTLEIELDGDRMQDRHIVRVFTRKQTNQQP